MKISYITNYNALDIHNWSGTGFNIAKALERQSAELQYIGELEINTNLLLRFKSKYYRHRNQQFDLMRESYVAKSYAKQAASRISIDSDVIFSPGSIPIALLKSKKPIVFYTDATFAGMVGFYDNFSSFCKETIRHGNYLEQKALDNSYMAIYSSEWAAKTAIDYYKVNPQKIKVVPFGANIFCDRQISDISQIVHLRNTTELNLLFVGVEWKRKGGDLAVKMAERLNKLGLKTTLHIVGIVDLPLSKIPDFIVNHGFISKSTPDGINHLNRLFSKCHLLLLPSFADCTPVVYSEANSFGLPCITSNVGGIPTIIKNEINGKTFSIETPLEVWCDYIFDLFSDQNKYIELCYSSFNEYQNRLNWNTAGQSIIKLLNEI